MLIPALGRQKGHAAILLIVLVLKVMASSRRSSPLGGPIVLGGQRRVVVALGGDHELTWLLQVPQRLKLFALLGGKLGLLQSAVKLMLRLLADDRQLLLLS